MDQRQDVYETDLRWETNGFWMEFFMGEGKSWLITDNN